MDTSKWCEVLRQQSAYHQAAAMLKAIEEHRQAIERIESSLQTLGEFAELARLDRRQLHPLNDVTMTFPPGTMPA